MNLDSASRLLNELGCLKILPRVNGWIQSTCPFAPYTSTHKNRRDDHPSFGVGPLRRGKGLTQSERDETIFGYNCFTCKIAGLLKWLVVRLERVSGKNLSHLYRYVQTDKTLDGLKSSPRGAAVAVLARAKRPAEPITEKSLDRFRSISLIPLKYLLSRGLTPASMCRWGLLWDSSLLRIVFPIRDEIGTLVGFSRREIRDSELEGVLDLDLPKFLHCRGFARDSYLYGEHLVGESRTAYLTEGFFDAIYLDQCGYTGAVALLGSYISRPQINKLIKRFDKVFIIGDGDKAGRKMTDDIFVKLSVVMDCKRIYLPEDKDPDNLSKEELQALLGPPESKTLDNRATVL